jgi:mitochondrial-processing peptidase subunit alpha
MLRVISKARNSYASIVRPTVRVLANRYHSYPDPNEVPKETRMLAKDSEVKRQIHDKSGNGFKLDESFGMEKVFPGVPPGTKVADSASAPKTQHTVLSTGLTVASQDMPGLMTSFAFIVGTGSSYENQKEGDGSNNTGVTQALELAAFKTTKNYKNGEISQKLEQLGGMMQCISTRENVLYCIDVLRENLEPALDILADAVLRPQFPIEEIEEAKDVARLMIDEMPSDMLSRDAATMAAYKGSAMGNTHFCPIESIDNITQNKLLDFHSNNFIANNCFITASGVEHDYFTSLVNKKFHDIIQIPNMKRNDIKLKRGISNYNGGLILSQRNLKEPYVKIAIGFEVGGWDDPDVIPKCVLNQLLGGGSSFSAGGPGKGMYTRLYTRVLNQNNYVESMESFIALNEDNGLLGVDAAIPPEYVHHVVRVIIEQLVNLAIVPVTDEELSRARNMCKSMLLMQLESRVVLCEDIARQYVTYGKRQDPTETCQLIDQVTADDLMRVADEMLNHVPAVGCVGHDLSNVPSYEDIRDFTKAYVTEGRRIKAAQAQQ